VLKGKKEINKANLQFGHLVNRIPFNTGIAWEKKVPDRSRTHEVDALAIVGHKN